MTRYLLTLSALIVGLAVTWKAKAEDVRPVNHTHGNAVVVGPACGNPCPQPCAQPCVPACPQACPQACAKPCEPQCVRIPDVKKHVVYGSRCVEICIKTCGLGGLCHKTCESDCDNCGKVRTVRVLLKKSVTDDCPGSKCVTPEEAVKYYQAQGAVAPKTADMVPVPLPK